MGRREVIGVLALSSCTSAGVVGPAPQGLEAARAGGWVTCAEELPRTRRNETCDPTRDPTREDALPSRADDLDQDAIRDALDCCPELPEDYDGFEDRDGCPDCDDDGDGLFDANVLYAAGTFPPGWNWTSDEDELRTLDCKLVPDGQCRRRDGLVLETLDCRDAQPERGPTVGLGLLSFERIPASQLDDDDDGHVNASDECPEYPEDFDGFDDHDGCPDCDNDGDGIPDADRYRLRADGQFEWTNLDRLGERDCRHEAEDFDGDADADGCPD